MPDLSPLPPVLLIAALWTYAIWRNRKPRYRGGHRA